MKFPKDLEQLLPMLEKAMKEGAVRVIQEEEKREYLGQCPKDLYDRYYQAKYKFSVAEAKCELLACRFAYPMGEKYAEVMKFEQELRELQKNRNPSKAEMMQGLKLMEKMISFKDDDGEISENQAMEMTEMVVAEVPEAKEASDEMQAIWEEIRKHFGLPEKTHLSIDRRGIVYKKVKTSTEMTPMNDKIKPFRRH